MNEWLDVLNRMMADNLWAAPLLSLLAGILTSFTPCSLASVPMLLACVGGAGENRRRVLALSLTMASGMAVTFGIFGSVASAAGHWMHEAGHWWAVAMGILMILMALQVFGLIHVIPHVHLSEKLTATGYTGAFLTGALSGLFASHCAIPVMVALLALAAEMGRDVWWGVFLMVLYAVGHSLLLILSGVGYGAVERMIGNPRYERMGTFLRGVLGTVVLCVGLLMIFGEK